MKIAVYPGSFDPITLGHVNVIERAAALFDRLIVCVGYNSAKTPLFTPEERVEMIRRCVRHVPNVTVDATDALIAEYARQQGACVLVKGLRAASDFESEFTMAMINKKLVPHLETIFLTAEERFMSLSSSSVKELAYYQVDLHDFLPEEIVDTVNTRMKERGVWKTKA